MLKKVLSVLLLLFLGMQTEAKVTPDASCARDAKNMILFWDNIESQQESFSSAATTQKISTTVKFSQTQRFKHWLELRKKLKKKIEVIVDEEVRVLAKKESMSEKGFLSGVYGAKYFQEEVKSANLKLMKREDALLKSVTFEVITDKLRDNSNFDPYKWGLSADEVELLRVKMEDVSAKIGIP